MTKSSLALSFCSHSTNMKKSHQYICVHKQVHLSEVYTILLIWVKMKFGHCLGSPLEFEMHSRFADATQIFCLALGKVPRLPFQITSSVSSRPSLSSSVQTLFPSTSSLSELTSHSVMQIQLFIHVLCKGFVKICLVTWTDTTEGCQFLGGDCNNMQHEI